MRVLHVLHNSVPFLAGYTVRSEYIMRFQRQQGMEVAGVTSGQHPNGESMHETIDGFQFWRTPMLTGSNPFGVREARLIGSLQQRVETAIQSFKPDILHAHSPMLVGIPALRAARKHKLPMVYELRDLWENPSIDRGKFKAGSLTHRAVRAAEDYVLHRADALIAICQTLRAEIERRKGANVPLFVVDNGVDVDRFTARPKRQELVDKYKLAGKSVLVYLGTFQPYEGVDLLVKAMPQVVAANPNAHLLIVGGGGELPQLQELAKTMKIENLVTFTGRVAHSEVVDMFPLGDLFVYPRLLTYTTALTTPLKPLEAMSMEKPTLVSDIPPMRELIDEPGVTGLLFKPGDQADLARVIIEALGDREKLDRIGQAGRRYVTSKRIWPQLVARYQGIYDTAISRSR